MTPVEIMRAALSKAHRDDEKMQRLAWLVSHMISLWSKSTRTPRQLYRSPFDKTTQGPKPLSAESKKKLKLLKDPKEVALVLMKEIET